jgi:hypothetical protein
MSEIPRLDPPTEESLRTYAEREAERAFKRRILWDVKLPRAVAIWISIVSMIGLALLVMGIWEGLFYQSIPDNVFHEFRKRLGILVMLYAIYCGWRLTTKVAIPRDLNQDFVPELVAYSIFWVLAPPIWFFVEYFAVASNSIVNLPGNPLNRAVIKDYADYASKIWAGVLALFLALIALKK